MMKADHRRLPFSISVDKNAADPDAFTSSQTEDAAGAAGQAVADEDAADRVQNACVLN
jgi:hypothetical protein